ncbi:MAG: peptidylprolyl isomerase [Saprospiraceae bacterium]
MKQLLKICLGLYFFALISSCGSKDSYVLIETEYGNMKVLLYNETPIHKENFLKLAGEGYYDGLLFHRVMRGFMIQGGDPNSRGAAPGAPLGGGGPGYLLDAEIGSPHFKGSLAAARTPDSGNPEKKSSGSQFYIVQGNPANDQRLDQFERMKGIKYTEAQRALYKEVGGRPDLDMEYTVFGEVVEGLEVIDKIAVVEGDRANRPVKDIKMKISVQ